MLSARKYDYRHPIGTNEDFAFEYDYMMVRGGYFVERTGSDGHNACSF